MKTIYHCVYASKRQSWTSQELVVWELDVAKLDVAELDVCLSSKRRHWDKLHIFFDTQTYIYTFCGEMILARPGDLDVLRHVQIVALGCS